MTVLLLSFDSNKIDYSDYAGAIKSGKTVQIIGSWKKDAPTKFDADANIFYFTMQDESGKVFPVKLSGAKPASFDSAPTIVAKGKVEGDEFHATEILTKCPSKYESEGGEHQKNAEYGR